MFIIVFTIKYVHAHWAYLYPLKHTENDFPQDPPTRAFFSLGLLGEVDCCNEVLEAAGVLVCVCVCVSVYMHESQLHIFIILPFHINFAPTLQIAE